jgi:type I restriction enzyme, R subunit
LLEQKTNLTIHKLRNNIQITQSDLSELEKMLFEQGDLGTKDQFIEAFGEQPLGKFIRTIVGLEVNAAKMAFSEFTSQSFNTQQIRFIDTIINFFSVKGIIEPRMLFEPPFTKFDPSGIMGIFDEATSTKILNIIADINHTAEAA